MADRDALAAHLQLFASLGVTGVSRDAAWRERKTAGLADLAGLKTGGSEERETAGLKAGGSEEHGAPDERSMEPPVFRPAVPSSMHTNNFDSDPAAALVALRHEIGDCTRCPLHKQGRTQVVFGVGHPNADLMFVGEAPGSDEDAQGEPFVGRAGQLLTKIIEAMGIQRSEVYIANVIKCRPPGNRNPEPIEVATCQPFLFRQIDTVRPRVVVALGTFAAHTLLGSDAPISRLRGHVYDFRNGSKLIPTFHPAFLLRSPDRKRDVWEDMKKVRALLAEQA